LSEESLISSPKTLPFIFFDTGILIPERQVKDIIERIGKIFEKLESQNKKVKKVVFLGDIKHSFTYEFQERDEFKKIMDFVKSKVSEENIILIKGNHDTMDYTVDKKMKPYHIEKSPLNQGKIAFLHGHMPFLPAFDKSVKLIVSGHLHPSAVISESPGVKQESYKCFLVGKSKGKTMIVVPSFVHYYEGTPVNYYREDYIESFSIIPEKDILKFRVNVIGRNETYDFGEVGEL